MEPTGQGSSRRRFLRLGAAGVLAAGTGSGRAQKVEQKAQREVQQKAQQKAQQAPLVLGQVGLSFYAVVGALVRALLEQLGHQVKLRSGPHEEMFPLLAAGEIDLMAAAWLPEGHGAYWARYGAGALEVARLYEGARFFWAVPDYVPASAVRAIADLGEPGVAARMGKTIQAIGAGAAITSLSQRAVERYGLDRAGYVLRPGSAEDWTRAYLAARAERRWIVFPTWTPHYLNRDGALRPLQDSLGVLGGSNHAAMVAPRARFALLPERTRAVLGRIRLKLEDVTEMDYQVNVGRYTPEQAARRWMAANEGVVRGWLGG